MASQNLASRMSGTQMVEFFQRMGRFDVDEKMMQKLLGDDELMKDWVKWLTMRTGSASELIHGVFNTTADIVRAFDERIVAQSLGTGRFQMQGWRVAPNYTEDPDVAVVLYATLDTLEQTWEFYEQWAAQQQMGHCHWPGFEKDADHLRLWGGEEFQPNTIRWLRLKLNANYQKSPMNVRERMKRLPCVEVMAALAQHPERVRRADGTAQRPYWWMGGLEANVSGFGLWSMVPHALFNTDSRMIGVGARSHWEVDSHCAVPEFFGE